MKIDLSSDLIVGGKMFSCISALKMDKKEEDDKQEWEKEDEQENQEEDREDEQEHQEENKEEEHEDQEKEKDTQKTANSTQIN